MRRKSARVAVNNDIVLKKIFFIILFAGRYKQLKLVYAI